MTPTRSAICDPDAFYPLRSLVEGSFRSWTILQPLEWFVRGIVLHDDMTMELEPWAFDPEADAEAAEREGPGPRSVMVAIGPRLNGYEALISGTEPRIGERVVPDVALSPEMLRAAADLANAEPDGPGYVYYKAHVEFMKQTLAVVRDGGSALCAGNVWASIDERATTFPHQLFATLDADWQEYASAADAGDIGPVIPPVLSIVLTQAGSREAIPAVLKDLRDTWAEPRAKVWAIVDAMKQAQTLREVNEHRRHLADASRLFSPKAAVAGPGPVRVLWNVFADAVKGAVRAVATGGNVATGAALGVAEAGIGIATKTAPDSLDALLRRGAFDLAARVRHQAALVEPMPALLSRFLTPAEKQKLGL